MKLNSTGFMAELQQKKRVMGIEPTYPAWKAGVLPLNYTRVTHIIIIIFLILSILFSIFSFLCILYLTMVYSMQQRSAWKFLL